MPITTRLFKNSHSQAVRIPVEQAYPNTDMDLVIERVGDESWIRPAARLQLNVVPVTNNSADFSAFDGLRLENWMAGH